MQRVDCPHCLGRLEVPEQGGLVVTCPYCSEAFTTPLPIPRVQANPYGLGYRCICPNCSHFNDLMEWQEQYRCAICGSAFRADGVKMSHYVKPALRKSPQQTQNEMALLYIFIMALVVGFFLLLELL